MTAGTLARPGREAICRSLQDCGETIKTQQALVRSCLADGPEPAAAEQLEELLRMLVVLRRRQRVLLRVWRSLQESEPVPEELLAESGRFADERRDLERLVADCRRRALEGAADERRQAWWALLRAAQRNLA